MLVNFLKQEYYSSLEMSGSTRPTLDTFMPINAFPFEPSTMRVIISPTYRAHPKYSTIQLALTVMTFEIASLRRNDSLRLLPYVAITV